MRFRVGVHKNVSTQLMKELLLDSDKWVRESVLNSQSKLSNIKEDFKKYQNNPYSFDENYLDTILEIALNPNSYEKLKHKLYRIYKNYHEQSLEVNSHFIECLIYQEINRINWKDQDITDYLENTYSKKSTYNLTDKELLEFWKYLFSCS